MKHKTILILSPHTDDGELGCGGTIAKFVEEGHNVVCAAFSTAKDSIPPGFPSDALRWEFIAAMKTLGVNEINLRIFDYPVRIFPNYRQNILEDILKLKKELSPDIVFLPSNNDIHQDHQVITSEGLRAFKKVSLLGYELPWNNIVFETRSFVKLNENHVNRKIEALKKYKTQMQRSYLNEDFIRGLAITRGTQFETKFAEAFEVLRFIIE